MQILINLNEVNVGRKLDYWKSVANVLCLPVRIYSCIKIMSQILIMIVGMYNII